MSDVNFCQNKNCYLAVVGFDDLCRTGEICNKNGGISTIHSCPECCFPSFRFMHNEMIPDDFDPIVMRLLRGLLRDAINNQTAMKASNDELFLRLEEDNTKEKNEECWRCCPGGTSTSSEATIHQSWCAFTPGLPREE